MEEIKSWIEDITSDIFNSPERKQILEAFSNESFETLFNFSLEKDGFEILWLELREKSIRVAFFQDGNVFYETISCSSQIMPNGRRKIFVGDEIIIIEESKLSKALYEKENRLFDGLTDSKYFINLKTTKIHVFHKKGCLAASIGSKRLSKQERTVLFNKDAKDTLHIKRDFFSFHNPKAFKSWMRFNENEKRVGSFGIIMSTVDAENPVYLEVVDQNGNRIEEHDCRDSAIPKWIERTRRKYDLIAFTRGSVRFFMSKKFIARRLTRSFTDGHPQIILGNYLNPVQFMNYEFITESLFNDIIEECSLIPSMAPCVLRHKLGRK